MVQIRTEEMDLIAQRGIASHYSGRGFVTGLVGRTIPGGRSSRGKTVCLNNANIALRVCAHIYICVLWYDCLCSCGEVFVNPLISIYDTILIDNFVFFISSPDRLAGSMQLESGKRSLLATWALGNLSKLSLEIY